MGQYKSGMFRILSVTVTAKLYLTAEILHFVQNDMVLTVPFYFTSDRIVTNGPLAVDEG